MIRLLAHLILAVDRLLSAAPPARAEVASAPARAPAPEWMMVRCPTCHAAAGLWCVGLRGARSGTQITRPHPARTRAAQEVTL